MVEYVDHLHEHFLDPVRMSAERYLLPERPGYSAQMHSETLARFAFPHGAEWAGGAVGFPTLAPKGSDSSADGRDGRERGSS